jgi:hypothetical protein
MRPLGWLPRWLQRALEAAVVAGVLGVVSLVASLPQLAAAGETPRLGTLGILLLAPPVLGVAVIGSAYPVALAATRSEALLGAIGALLLAADAVALLVRSPVLVETLERRVPVGVLAAGLALLAGGAGLGVGQVASRLGFGRRAGAITSVAAAIAGVVVLIGVAPFA